MPNGRRPGERSPGRFVFGSIGERPGERLRGLASWLRPSPAGAARARPRPCGAAGRGRRCRAAARGRSARGRGSGSRGRCMAICLPSFEAVGCGPSATLLVVLVEGDRGDAALGHLRAVVGVPLGRLGDVVPDVAARRSRSSRASPAWPARSTWCPSPTTMSVRLGVDRLEAVVADDGRAGDRPAAARAAAERRERTTTEHGDGACDENKVFDLTGPDALVQRRGGKGAA